MSPLGRVGRRPDHWATPHERARVRAAEQLDDPLDPLEAAWLDEHLDGCQDCRAVAAAYEIDRAALRSLRDVRLDAPRDLWARTAAGIEREASRGRFGRGDRRPAWTGSRIPLGAMSGMAVAIVVVGATLLSGRSPQPPTAIESAPGATVALASPTTSSAPSDPGPTLAPAATPMAVVAGPIQWLRSGSDGSVTINEAPIDHVCPVDDAPSCAALDDQTARKIMLKNRPKSVVGSPDDLQAVVVASDGSGQDQVIVLVLPTLPPTPVPTESASSTETTNPLDTPAPTPSETASEAPTGSDGPEPSDEPPASIDPNASPSVSPEPSVALELAIASGVTVVGDSAAFSADGSWFAFTARPADGSAGPDVFVWHVGDLLARPLTSDGSTVFASWDGGTLVASRPGEGELDGERPATSVRIDPVTGEAVGGPFDVWRPVIDPTGQFAVAWNGTVLVDADSLEPRPATGALGLMRWSVDGADPQRATIDLGDASTAHVDVRWDVTGSWFAIWTGSADDATIGRLSLFHLDPSTGTFDRPSGAPTDVPALAGFSIDDGRLAWVTPKGQDAEGSRVQVVAWSGSEVGAVETVPGEGVIVVR